MSVDTRGHDSLQHLIDRLGPDVPARLLTPLSDTDALLVDEILARHGGDPVAALDAQHLPADVQATMRRVMKAEVR